MQTLPGWPEAEPFNWGWALGALIGIPLLCVIVFALIAYGPRLAGKKTGLAAGPLSLGDSSVVKALSAGSPGNNDQSTGGGQAHWHKQEQPFEREIFEGQVDDVDRTIDSAQQESGLTISARAALANDQGSSSQMLHASLTDPRNSILINVQTDPKSVEIVTGETARRSISDVQCDEIAEQMATDLAHGNLFGALNRGIELLTQAATTGHLELETSH